MRLSMPTKLFIISVIAIPFSDFAAILPLGELDRELSAYLFIITMCFVIASHLQLRKAQGEQSVRFASTYPLPQIMSLLLIIIGISFIMNFPAMLHGNFRGRVPMNKFLTSLLVVLYGFGLAYISYYLGQKESWHRLIVRPVAISVAITSLVAIFEMISWFGGVFDSAYAVLSSMVHLGPVTRGYGSALAGWSSDIEGRVRSICFEPPALANYAGFAWPWVYAGIYSARKKAKPAYIALWLLCTGLVIVAMSRTSFVLLAGNIVVLLLLRTIYLSPQPKEPIVHRTVSFFIMSLTAIAIVAFLFNTDNVTSYIISGTNVSNISRFASITAAFRMFADSPIWGYGFGQYGFHILDYMPSWGYYSWEIRMWLVNPFAVWPPVFSIYARFAAELGILGLVAWIGIWFVLARSIWRITLAYQHATGKVLLMSYPLIISCYCVLFSGIALDSMRTPMMWITLGLGCCYLRQTRFLVLQHQHDLGKVPETPIASDNPVAAV